MSAAPATPQDGKVYHIRNSRHSKFLSVSGGMRGGTVVLSSSPANWIVRACPHQVGTFYLECKAAFLDTHGTDCSVWNNNGSSVKNLISGNTSKAAGNLRWGFAKCGREKGSYYIINSRHGTFLDADAGGPASCWNNNGSSVANIISGNTSKYAGNLRWYFVEVGGGGPPPPDDEDGRCKSSKRI